MNETTTQEMRKLARILRAAHAWSLGISAQVAIEMLSAAGTVSVVRPLTGPPVECIDIKARGLQAREEGSFLLVDTTLTGARGCEALRLGAHACVCGLSSNQSVVGISRDADKAMPDVRDRVGTFAQTDSGDEETVIALIDAADELWHQTSDAAQVVATYLRCHPSVSKVSYPGLKGDPSFEIAARTLQRGFGPFVDVRLVGDDRWHRVRCDESDVRAQILMLEQGLSMGNAFQDAHATM